jgi:hypothetical protein
MRVVIYLVSACLLVIGVIWILQGYSILPGSFMTGRIEWAHRGEAAAGVGVLLFIVAQMLPKE